MSAVLAEPGSAMWLEQRCGRLTASRIADAFRKKKGGDWAQTRRTYQIELLADRLTGLATDHYVSREMLWGIEHEADAIAAYEFDHDVTVQPGAFREHPTIPMAGATPDGFVAEIGLVEIKNPKTTTFIEIVLDDAPDADHVAQCLWQLASCPERAWVDLRYNDVRLPIGVGKYEIRIEREVNAEIIKDMETEARAFLDELAELQKRFV